MKGYRKLAPGEVIREGDVCLVSDLYPRPSSGIAWRKARTDDTPPGWRWADAGERTSYEVDSGKLRRFVGVCTTEHDYPLNPDAQAYGKCGPVMPYPEDPRLEE